MKSKDYKEGYEKGVDDALRGQIESMHSLTIKEIVNVPDEIRKIFFSQERARGKKIVEDYLVWAEKEYIDFTERGLTMLGYDFHSRIVACKHLLNNFDQKSKDYEKLYD